MESFSIGQGIFLFDLILRVCARLIILTKSIRNQVGAVGRSLGVRISSQILK